MFPLGLLSPAAHTSPHTVCFVTEPVILADGYADKAGRKTIHRQSFAAGIDNGIDMTYTAATVIVRQFFLHTESAAIRNDCLCAAFSDDPLPFNSLCKSRTGGFKMHPIRIRMVSVRQIQEETWFPIHVLCHGLSSPLFSDPFGCLSVASISQKLSSHKARQ